MRGEPAQQAPGELQHYLSEMGPERTWFPAGTISHGAMLQTWILRLRLRLRLRWTAWFSIASQLSYPCNHTCRYYSIIRAIITHFDVQIDTNRDSIIDFRATSGQTVWNQIGCARLVSNTRHDFFWSVKPWSVSERMVDMTKDLHGVTKTVT